MTVWDPPLYLRFRGHRIRPALELLAQIEIEPASIIDLGCGTGASTSLLAARWPEARIVGLDNSPEMLERARRDHPGLELVEADIAGWAPDAPFDLVFANAALQWLDRHDLLFPRLAGAVAPGGVLAVQMPHNHAEAAYRLVDEIGRSERWHSKLAAILRPAPVAGAAHYYDVLAPVTERLDVWETEYLQVLEGDNPVAQWLTGTFLRPVLEALGSDAEAFREQWANAVAACYPRRGDGTTLFPFKRLFIVARC